MGQSKKEQQVKEGNEWQCGCFEPSSRFDSIMMKKMCGSMNKNKFDWESMMKEMKWCKQPK